MHQTAPAVLRVRGPCARAFPHSLQFADCHAGLAASPKLRLVRHSGQLGVGVQGQTYNRRAAVQALAWGNPADDCYAVYIDLGQF